MTSKYFYISLVFFCFTANACAKSEHDKNIFATSVSVVTDKKVDIDGDAHPDTVDVVTISKTVSILPPSIKLVVPWASNDGEEKKSPSLAAGSHNNLFISFGNSKQFLVHDVNNVSLLDTEAAHEISTLAKSSLSELELPELSERAKGDVIVIPTEAGIDIYLYWDGSTFQTYVPTELP